MNRIGSEPRSIDPMDLEGDYRSELTKESYKELKNHAFWAKGEGPLAPNS